MTAEREVLDVPDLPADAQEVTLADVLLELADVVVEVRRIADVIAPRPRSIVSGGCGERHDGARCILDDRHRGPHVSGDGQTRWVDDD